MTASSDATAVAAYTEQALRVIDQEAHDAQVLESAIKVVLENANFVIVNPVTARLFALRSIYMDQDFDDAKNTYHAAGSAYNDIRHYETSSDECNSVARQLQQIRRNLSMKCQSKEWANESAHLSQSNTEDDVAHAHRAALSGTEMEVDIFKYVNFI